MPKSNILIIGGLGYLGSRLTRELSQTHNVSISTRSLSPIRKRWLESLPNKVSLFDLNALSFSKFDAVLHLAVPSAAECAKDVEAAKESVLLNLQRCEQAMRAGHIGKLIHFSTFHVYGGTPRPVYRESDSIAPSHAYGEVHAFAEKFLETLSAKHPVFIVRLTNAIGSPEHSDLGSQAGLFFLDCLKQAASSGTIRLKNDGNARRDFVPMSDVSRAVRLFLSSDGRHGDTVNLSSGVAISLNDFLSGIAREIHAVQGENPKIEWGSAKDPFDIAFEVNHDRLVGWGWSPVGNVYEEVAQSYQFFRKANAA